MMKNKEWERKMCFFDHSFVHIFFVFHFVTKTHAWIPRKYDVLWNCFKIQQLQLSLEEKSTFFSAPEVMTRFSEAWCLSIFGQAAKATYVRTHPSPKWRPKKFAKIENVYQHKKEHLYLSNTAKFQLFKYNISWENWKIYRHLYDWGYVVIQTFLNFSIFNSHFLSWYYTWNAETLESY